MSRLREPGLGPLVGHTTDNACRLWIRAGDPEDSGHRLASARRTVGLITVVKDGGEDTPDAPVYYFRLHREYDRTGAFMLGQDISLGNVGEVFKMRPDTEYVIRMGTLTLDDPLSDAETIENEELVSRLPLPDALRADLAQFSAERSEATFRTFPRADTVAENISFVVGSCRYPGLLWRVKHADRAGIFGFPPVRAGPLRGEHRRGRAAPSRRFLPGRKSSREAPTRGGGRLNVGARSESYADAGHASASVSCRSGSEQRIR